MTNAGDNSYLITGKVCPPQLPMENVSFDGWNTFTPSLIDLLFTETSVQGKQTSILNPLSALSFQASVWLSTDGNSASSVVGLPYFFCNFCDYHTDSKIQLLRHTACQHAFKCKICDLISITRYELVQHQLLKHLDDEEMQPILSSKLVHLNLSFLQRRLTNMSKCDNSSNDFVCSGSRCDKSDLIHSSQVHISDVFPAVQHEVISQELTDKFKCRPVLTKNENPVTSSKCTLPKTTVNSSVNSDSVRRPEWHSLADSNETGRLPKRDYPHVELRNDELSVKRFRKSTDECQANLNMFIPSQSDSRSMPHFLDESDSNVTSSSSPKKNTVPVLMEDMTGKSNVIKSTGRAHDPNSTSRVLSFLTEPISSTASFEITNSSVTCDGNSNSALCDMQKILHWYNDEANDIFKETGPRPPNVSQALLEAGPRPPNVSQTMLEYSNDSPSLVKTSEVDFYESSNHPKYSNSREKRHMQLQKSARDDSGDLFLESCQGLFRATHSSSQILLPRRSTSPQSSELSTRFTSDVAAENAIAGTGCRGRHSDVNSQNIENFLVTPEHIKDTIRLTKKENNIINTQDENDCNNDRSKSNAVEDVEATSSADEGFKYDLLRKLLIGASAITEHAVTTTSFAEVDGKPHGAVFSKDFPQRSKESSQLKLHAPPLLTRASDMSLKDLLTQSLENIPATDLFACSYCSWKWSTKAELQRHVEKCRWKRGLGKPKAHTYGLSGEVVCNPEPLNNQDNIVKAKLTTAMDTPVKGFYPSDQFMASEVLKSLSDHYSESLSSDISCLDNSHTPEIDFQNGESNSMLKGHTLGLEKAVLATHHLPDVNGKRLRHRPERKKNPEVDYSNDSSESSSNVNFDSDYTPRSVSKARKKNKRKHNNKREFTLNSKCFSNDAIISQQFSPDFLPEIHYTCLYCNFSTENIIKMRQHLVNSHCDQAPFAESLCQSKQKVILYFCRGAQSRCKFTSKEWAEIFEHIKLCYSGCIDNFIDSDSLPLPDYSPVLQSLAEASNFIDQSAATFYCLRCNYSRPDFHQVASHVSNDHGPNVAGLLYINKDFKGLIVEMVCLVCSANISVKQWACHACRRISRNDISLGDVDLNIEMSPSPKLETYLRLSNIPSNQTFIDEDAIGSCKLDSGSQENYNNFEEDSKLMSQMKYNAVDISHNLGLNSSTLQSSCTYFDANSFSEDVNIKKEIPDVYLIEDETLDSVPVHLSQVGQTLTEVGRTGQVEAELGRTGLTTTKLGRTEQLQANLGRTRQLKTDLDKTIQLQADLDRSGQTWTNLNRAGKLLVKDSHIGSDAIDQQFRTINSSYACHRKISAGCSVLQSLLTAPKDPEPTPKSFSLLQNLLQPDHAVKERVQLKPLSIIPPESTSATLNTQLQYPCILEMLSRQDLQEQESMCADSSPASFRADRMQNKTVTDNSTNQLSCFGISSPCSPQVSSQHSAASKCLPNVFVSTNGKQYPVSTAHLSPSILHPSPVSLLSPFLSTLASSPPSSPATLLTSTPSQDTPGPFANLLRLLSKTKFNSASVEEHINKNVTEYNSQ